MSNPPEISIIQNNCDKLGIFCGALSILKIAASFDISVNIPNYIPQNPDKTDLSLIFETINSKFTSEMRSPSQLISNATELGLIPIGIWTNPDKMDLLSPDLAKYISGPDDPISIPYLVLLSLDYQKHIEAFTGNLADAERIATLISRGFNIDMVISFKN